MHDSCFQFSEKKYISEKEENSKLRKSIFSLHKSSLKEGDLALAFILINNSEEKRTCFFSFCL